MSNIVEKFYSNLNTSVNPEADIKLLNVTNSGSEELSNITIEELEHALSQMKANWVSLLSFKWQNPWQLVKRWSHSVIQKRREIRNRIYLLTSLLPHPYEFLTKIIFNRLTNKFDQYLSSKQAGFWKSFSTDTEHQGANWKIHRI